MANTRESGNHNKIKWPTAELRNPATPTKNPQANKLLGDAVETGRRLPGQLSGQKRCFDLTSFVAPAWRPLGAVVVKIVTAIIIIIIATGSITGSGA